MNINHVVLVVDPPDLKRAVFRVEDVCFTVCGNVLDPNLYQANCRASVSVRANRKFIFRPSRNCQTVTCARARACVRVFGRSVRDTHTHLRHQNTHPQSSGHFPPVSHLTRLFVALPNAAFILQKVHALHFPFAHSFAKLRNSTTSECRKQNSLLSAYPTPAGGSSSSVELGGAVRRRSTFEAPSLHDALKSTVDSVEGRPAVKPTIASGQ